MIFQLHVAGTSAGAQAIAHSSAVGCLLYYTADSTLVSTAVLCTVYYEFRKIRF